MNEDRHLSVDGRAHHKGQQSDCLLCHPADDMMALAEAVGVRTYAGNLLRVGPAEALRDQRVLPDVQMAHEKQAIRSVREFLFAVNPQLSKLPAEAVQLQITTSLATLLGLLDAMTRHPSAKLTVVD